MDILTVFIWYSIIAYTGIISVTSYYLANDMSIDCSGLFLIMFAPIAIPVFMIVTIINQFRGN